MITKVSAPSLVIAFCMALTPIAFSQQFVSSHRVGPYSKFLAEGETAYGGIYGVADFNHDGRPDFLISALNAAGTNFETALMLQNSQGNFTMTYLPSLPASGATAVVDVNGDGRPDVISVIPAPSDDHNDPTGPATLKICLETASGSFSIQTINLPENNGGSSVLVTDINGDGNPDIVAVTYDQYGDATLQTFLNQGSGHFKAGPTYASGLTGGALLASGVFTSSGHVDLVVNNNFQLQILIGNGAGSFSPGAIYNLNPAYVGVGDFNKDHHQDLAVVVGQTTTIMLGNGNGTFNLSGTLATSFGLGTYVNFGSGVIADGIYVADLNHDGNLDIAVPTTSSTQAVSVYLGKGNGTFQSPKVYNVSGSGFSFGEPTAFADLNNDGQIDALSLNIYSAGFTVARGDGHGGFVAPQTTFAPNPGAIAEGDFNKDGIEDIAVVNQPLCRTCNVSVSVFLGTAKGAFQTPHKYPIPFNSGVVSVGDVNRDGRLDLVVTRSGGFLNQTVVPLPPSSSNLSVLLGKGDGTFDSPVSYNILGTPPKSTINESAYLIDVNHDGKLDLVGDWGVALGNGTGTFQTPIPFPSGIQSSTLGITAIAPGNFDGTANPGLVIGSNNYNSVYQAWGDPAYLYVLSGLGNGHFKIDSKQTLFSVDTVVAADLNGDGHPDIVCQCQPSVGSSTDLIVEINEGSGAFTQKGYSIPESALLIPGVVLTGDFNRDGKTDVVLFGGFSNAGDVALLLGTGGGNLNATPSFYQGYLTSGVVLDLNKDGAPDIAGTSIIGIERLMNTGVR